MDTEPTPQQADRSPEDLKRMEDVITQGGEGFLHFLRSNYKDTNGHPDNRLFFHDEEHTHAVASRVVDIVKGLRECGVQVTKEQELRSVLAAYGHDLVQNWEVNEENGKRKRKVGDNEKESADMVILWMDHIDAVGEKPVFTHMDRAVVREAILTAEPKFGTKVTIKTANGDEVTHTVGQPRLAKAQFLESHILALADITTSGMAEPEVMIREGQKLFREDNLELSRALETNTVTRELETKMSEEMDKWLESQVQFTRARDALLDPQLKSMGLNETQIAYMRENVFNKFADVVKATQERSDEFKQMSAEPFQKKMAYMGY